MSQKTVTLILASAVVAGGTFTVTYPSGTGAAHFQQGTRHTMTALGANFSAPTDFRITTFGNTTCTITTGTGMGTLPAGTVVRVGLDAAGPNYREEKVQYNVPSQGVSTLTPVRVVLGAPVAADDDGLLVSGGVGGNAFQGNGYLGTISMNGAVVTAGVATLDVPRNIQIVPGGDNPSSSTVFTVRGTDVDGQSLTEQLANQTTSSTVLGVKAFKTVSSVVISGVSINSTFLISGKIGFGDVLGLPVFLPNTNFVFKELQDGGTASAGTTVAGLAPQTKSTATTADVRGTYDPSAACDGSKAFELLVFLSDPSYRGNPQFNS